MRHHLLFAILLFVFSAGLDAAGAFLTENGEPRAEIIISEKPQRSARLAAQELQDQIVKISGARLPILTQPTGKAVKVFVGASALSPVRADGLQHGAYRIVTGADWMALVGDDTDFTQYAKGGEVWNQPRPKDLGKPKPLSSKKKSAAKAAAKAAGRPYPNLIDNMRMARK